MGYSVHNNLKGRIIRQQGALSELSAATDRLSEGIVGSDGEVQAVSGRG